MMAEKTDGMKSLLALLSQLDKKSPPRKKVPSSERVFRLELVTLTPWEVQGKLSSGEIVLLTRTTLQQLIEVLNDQAKTECKTEDQAKTKTAGKAGNRRNSGN
jgi:hypothetical protein